VSQGTVSGPRPPRGWFWGARIGVLVLVLLFTAAWGARVAWLRRERRAWERPVEAGLVLLSPTDGVDAEAWRRGADALEQRLAAEMARWRGPGGLAFRVTVIGPVRWDGALPFSPSGSGPIARASHAVEVWRTLHAVDRAAGGGTGGFDVQVLLLCAPLRDGQTGFAEGSGARGGEVAMVRGSCTGDPSLALQAVGHELLHTVGATDKYDGAGHAVIPEGLADPARDPPLPQDHAEWMVGEVPLAPGRGRLPESLAEMRVGPATAREIGWARPGAP
jgi:hypothetical protein